MAMAITGTDSTSDISSRWRHDAVGSCSAAGGASVPVEAEGGVGDLGGVAGLLDGGHEILGRHITDVVDACLLGGVVHRGGDAVELVELLLDPVRARGAGHATNFELDLAVGGRVLRDGIHRSSSRGGVVVGQCPCPAGIGSGGAAGTAAGGLPAGQRELGGPHHSIVLEVQEQAVVARARGGDKEVDTRTGRGDPVAGVAVRMHVQVAEIGGPQRHQVPVRPPR